MLDIHAHLLPGLDDGASSDLMALDMLKAACQAGVDRIVATPHVRTTQQFERIRAVYQRWNALAGEQGIGLISGCELSVRTLAGGVVTPDAIAPYRIGETRFVLLEFPSDVLPVDWEYLVSDVPRAGFCAIIAHPERYRYVAQDPALALGFLRYGCELQLDAKSFLCGRFSPERRAAENLLDSGIVSYIASDAHCPQDFHDYLAVRRRLGKRWPTDGRLETLLPERAAG